MLLHDLTLSDAKKVRKKFQLKKKILKKMFKEDKTEQEQVTQNNLKNPNKQRLDTCSNERREVEMSEATNIAFRLHKVANSAMQ